MQYSLLSITASTQPHTTTWCCSRYCFLASWHDLPLQGIQWAFFYNLSLIVRLFKLFFQFFDCIKVNAELKDYLLS